MSKSVHVFIFVDSLGWQQVNRFHFLEDLLPYRKSIEMQFGYSCTAIPTILSGKRPSEHGHLAFFDYAPSRSPFRKWAWLRYFFKPKSFWSRGRVRHQVSKLFKKLCGFTGYFQLYAMPLERLPLMDYCEKRDMFVPGGLAPIQNLADVWQAQGQRYHISDWHLSEGENFARATALLREGALDRCFIYSADFDALQHDHVEQDDTLQPKVDGYAQRIRAVYEALQAAGQPFELTVFSDHGMTPLRGTIDLPQLLRSTNLTWGEDYALCLDSTMARFWWLKPEAEQKIRGAIAAANLRGRFLTDDEVHYHGIDRKDKAFGDAIYLADAGVQFVPSDMGMKPLNGMHGFDPADKDSFAAMLATVPLPASVSRICDVFGWMTAQ